MLSAVSAGQLLVCAGTAALVAFHPAAATSALLPGWSAEGRGLLGAALVGFGVSVVFGVKGFVSKHIVALAVSGRDSGVVLVDVLAFPSGVVRHTVPIDQIYAIRKPPAPLPPRSPQVRCGARHAPSRCSSARSRAPGPDDAWCQQNPMSAELSAEVDIPPPPPPPGSAAYGSLDLDAESKGPAPIAPIFVGGGVNNTFILDMRCPAPPSLRQRIRSESATDPAA